MKKNLIFFLTSLLLGLLAGNFGLATNGWKDELLNIENIIRNVAIAGAVLMIVIGGFEWMISAGDPQKIASAKEKIYSAIFGLIIIALATTIASLVGINR